MSNETQIFVTAHQFSQRRHTKMGCIYAKGGVSFVREENIPPKFGQIAQKYVLHQFWGVAVLTVTATAT